MNEENTKKLLLEMPDPVLGEPLEKFRPTLHVRKTDARVDVSLTMGYPVRLVEKVFREAVEKKFSENGLALGRLELTTEVIAHRVKGVIKTLPNVKNVIAVASGKGGVGKSTVTANVALALAEAGLKVGVLDADIYGPSQPTMLGAVGSPESEDGVTMPPLVSHGLEINSIGFMTDPDEPVIWRGPMASGALSQLFNQTAWNHLDCLVVDLPPGTGDIQLTLAQTLPLTGAIVVTTPQDVSYIDAAKALQMFETLGIPVFGVVENMALFKCPKCGHMERIFGEGAAKKLCEKFGVTVLGELPLETEIRSACDKGEPTLVSAPQSDAAQTFRTIALMTTARLALLPKDYSQVIPSVKAAPKP